MRKQVKKPRAVPEATEIQTSIRVDRDVWKEARMIALDEGRTVGELIAEALIQYRTDRARREKYRTQKARYAAGRVTSRTKGE